MQNKMQLLVSGHNNLLLLCVLMCVAAPACARFSFLLRITRPAIHFLLNKNA
jgi:hypothetical protein